MTARLRYATRGARAATLGVVAAVLWTTAALANGPVAVVEEVTGHQSGVDFMDYVETGKLIKLGPHDHIVLDYLKSCWREIITGGTVTVGPEQSDLAAAEPPEVSPSEVAMPGAGPIHIIEEDLLDALELPDVVRLAGQS